MSPTLSVQTAEHEQVFRIGDGKARQSRLKIQIPCAVQDKKCALQVCQVDQEIPCLASRPATTCLGMILDTVTGNVHFRNLGATSVPLKLAKPGHWCVCQLSIGPPPCSQKS